MNREEAAKYLGCTAESSQEEIKRQYKKMALRMHPDRPGGSEKSFLQLNKAYEALLSTKSEGVTKDVFDRFKEMYQGSEEEKEELISLYKKHKGRMSRVIDGVMFGEDEQEERYRRILDKEIKDKALEEYPQYKKIVMEDKRRQKKREKEAEMAKELLQQMDQRRANREENWNRMIERLEDEAEEKKRGRKGKKER